MGAGYGFEAVCAWVRGTDQRAGGWEGRRSGRSEGRRMGGPEGTVLARFLYAAELSLVSLASAFVRASIRMGLGT